MSNDVIKLPIGRVLSKCDLVDDLSKDMIILGETDLEDEFLKRNYASYIQRTIVDNRYKDKREHLIKYYEHKLSDILTEKFIADKLPDVINSSKVINDVIANKGKCVLICDFDTDGVTSGAVGHKMFKGLLDYEVEIVVNNRKWGRGITDVVVEIVNSFDKVDLVLTSDHGSQDKINLNKIRDFHKCKVVVTDHHPFKEKDAPLDMDAFINPQRYNNELSDITGTHVLYYTLLHAYYTGDYNKNSSKLDYIYYLLTYVAMTTISDCMDLKNYVNRKILIKALSDLNNKNKKHESFWRVMGNTLKSSYIIDESTIGFKVTPLLNSPGRVKDPRLSIELLISEDDDRTLELLEEIKLVNTMRRDKQTAAGKTTKREEYGDGKTKVLVIEDSDGIQGINASDIMYSQNYNLVISFTKTMRDGNLIYTGSGRCRDDSLSLKELIQSVADKSDMIISHGGHKQAIGMAIKPDLKAFYDLLKKEVDATAVKKIDTYQIEDYIYSDMKLVLHIFDVIAVAPYGIGFETPLFASDLVIHSYRIFKGNRIFVNLKVKLSNGSSNILTMFYNVSKTDLPAFEKNMKDNKYIRVVYSLNINSYRNSNTILLNAKKIIFKD